jgi:hypothetical protein
MLNLLKYGTHDCPACRRMAAFDARVAGSLGLAFVDVDMKDTALYRRYRKVLLERYPLKRELQIPAYLLVEDPEGSFAIHGEISGPVSEADFSSRLRAQLEALPPAATSDPPGSGG